MKFSSVSAVLVAAAAPGVHSYPGMNGKLMEDIQLEARYSTSDSTELLGDLLHLPYNKLSPVGKDIKELLQGGGVPTSEAVWYGALPSIDSKACRKDTCCIWQYIANTMHAKFLGSSGRCTDFARYAVRLGFHDAGGWSKPIIMSGVEEGRTENLGLDDIFDQMKEWYDHYHTKLGYPVTMADLIQVGATVATVTCPLGPRVKSYVGRKDSTVPAPQLLPTSAPTPTSLIQLFKDKTIGPKALAALLAPHTTSQQEFVDLARELAPQDSTPPGVWDTLIYNETLGKAHGGVNPPKRVLVFASDSKLSVHPAVAPTGTSLPPRDGQAPWNEVRVSWSRGIGIVLTNLCSAPMRVPTSV